MRLGVPLHLTVQVDKQEKIPVLFPSVCWYHPTRQDKTPRCIRLKVEVVKLDAGDYRLANYPECCIIERKGSLRELSGNLHTADYGRFRRALERLRASCSHPYLLIDESFSAMVTASRDPTECRAPEQVMDALNRELIRMRIPLLWIGGVRSTRTRTRMGDYLVRLMLAHALESLT